MRTNIVIDNSLMRQAMKATGLSTKKAVVEEGRRLLIKVKGQEGIRRLCGKIEWEGDLSCSQHDLGEVFKSMDHRPTLLLLLTPLVGRRSRPNQLASLSGTPHLARACCTRIPPGSCSRVG